MYEYCTCGKERREHLEPAREGDGDVDCQNRPTSFREFGAVPTQLNATQLNSTWRKNRPAKAKAKEEGGRPHVPTTYLSYVHTIIQYGDGRFCFLFPFFYFFSSSLKIGARGKGRKKDMSTLKNFMSKTFFPGVLFVWHCCVRCELSITHNEGKKKNKSRNFNGALQPNPISDIAWR